MKRIGLTLMIAIAMLLIVDGGFVWPNLKLSADQIQSSAVIETPSPTMEPNRLVIPSLKLDVPIVYADKVSESDFQKDLENGVVHYPDTAKPGEFGNAYIFGHSSDFIWSKGNYKYVFATLPRIKIGDEVNISDSSGNKFVYIVKETRIVSPSDTSVLQQDNSRKILTLQTSYPLGTALKRFIVIAQAN